MTDRELMQQALEALEEINKLSIGEHAICLPAEIDGAMDALRGRLAQPEQKPYAWMAVGGTIWRHKATEDDTPIYTHPPQRKPLVWLSEEEERQIKDHCTTVAAVLRAVKAKLKEKNT